MGNLTINNGGIVTNSTNVPNIDLRYGPYENISEAYRMLGSTITPGLTVGLIEDGEIKEYIVNDDYQLTPKLKLKTINNQPITGEGNITIQEGGDYTELTNIPHISDNNTEVPLQGTLQVSAETTTGVNAEVTLDTSISGKIKMKFTLPKGADGQNGAPGNNGHNPNLGTYLDTDTLPTTGQSGDYIYVVDTSVTPRTANVYAWNGTAFADTGKSVEDFGLQFASGQTVPDTAIKDLNGNNDPSAAGVLSAEAGRVLKTKLISPVNQKITTPTYTSALSITTGTIPVEYPSNTDGYNRSVGRTYKGWIDTSGNLVTNVAKVFTLYPVGESLKAIAKIGDVIKFVNTSENSIVIAFLSSAITITGSSTSLEGVLIDGTRQAVAAGNTEFVEVPAEAKFMYVILNNKAAAAPTNTFELSVVQYIRSELRGVYLEENIDLSIIGEKESRIYPKDETTTQNRGKIHASASYRHLSPNIKKYAYLLIKANDTNPVYVCFLQTLIGTKGSGTIPDYASGWFGVEEVSAGASAILPVPQDATYLYLYAGYTSTDTVAPRTFVPIEIKGYIAQEEYIGESHSSEKKGIFKNYSQEELLLKMMALKYYSTSVTDGSVVIGHISDCHGYSAFDGVGTGIDQEALSRDTWQRFVDFCRYWKEQGLLDELVDTGDIVNARYSNSISWRQDNNDFTKTVLNTIGNHDTQGSDGQWTANAGANAYSKFIAPYIENWGVTQPDSPAGENYAKCYYYKDYTKNNKILRILFLDPMGWDNDEKTWVQEKLQECVTNEYRVAIYTHLIPSTYTENNMTGTRAKAIRCSFSSAVGPLENDYSGGYNAAYHELAGLVNSFQKAFYTAYSYNPFMGYFVGHRHKTQISILQGSDGGVDFGEEAGKYPQLIFATGAGDVNTGTGRTSEVWRKKGTDNQDNFQIEAISPLQGYVKVMKIGCRETKWMQKRDVVAVSAAAYLDFDETRTDYKAGDVVYRYGELWKFKNPVVIPAYTDWLLTGKEKYERSSGDETTYPEFDSTTIYNANNIVRKDGELWKLTSPYAVSAHTDWAASDKELYSRVISE